MNDIENWRGEERRCPESHNPCKYTLERIVEEVRIFADSMDKNQKILDFGCGEKPYLPFFQDNFSEYIGLDIGDSPEKNANVNIIIKQGDNLPFVNEYFDVIISTQVFEHLEDIHFYAKELNRVLKTGGRMLVSAAFAWDFHPYPNDFWRISKDGYRVIFKDFSEIRFSHDTNSLQTIMQSVNLLMARQAVKFKFPYRFINFIVSKINYKKGDDKFPANIFVYLKK